MNPVKTRNVVFSLKRNKQVHPPLILNSNNVKDAESHTHLGLTLQSSMSWRKHIVQVYEKASKRLNMLKFVIYKFDRSILTSLYKSLIRPLMEYGDVIWNNCCDCDSALLDTVQYEAARLVTGAIKGTSSARLYKELAWESLSSRRKLHLLSQFYKIVKHLAPYYLSELNYLVSEHIIVLGQGKTLHNFHVELLAFKSLSSHPPLLVGILWT